MKNTITKMAKFEKVSLEQFMKDWKNVFPDEDSDEVIEDIYENIKIPKRATVGSAGYDFFLPMGIDFVNNSNIIIPTGVKCYISEGWVLKIYPRSGQSFKYGIHLANTVGIIDSDYSYADNDGHIMVKLVNESILAPDNLFLEEGTAFCQGIFTPFGIVEDDNVSNKRNGGIGSTDM